MVAIFSVIFAKQAANRARRNVSGELYLRFMSDYGSPEFCEAMRCLREWKDRHNGDFAGQWRSELAKGDSRARQVDMARRRIKYYFLPLAQLKSAGYVDEKLFHKVCEVRGVSLLLEIVKPLEKTDENGALYWMKPYEDMKPQQIKSETRDGS